mmetsp:Transcript_29846/g.62388  ORF Transcript_29846/g.62388 Transcript_29846/m.62388 type:complete len:113 (+) Transcript_29846:929-1267(+)
MNLSDKPLNVSGNGILDEKDSSTKKEFAPLQRKHNGSKSRDPQPPLQLSNHAEFPPPLRPLSVFQDTTSPDHNNSSSLTILCILGISMLSHKITITVGSDDFIGFLTVELAS